MPVGISSPGNSLISFYHDQNSLERIVISARRCRLHMYRGIVDQAVIADRFLQVHDKATLPNPGDVPVWEMMVACSFSGVTQYCEGSEDFSDIGGMKLANGLSLVISTSPGNYTSPGGAEVRFQAAFELA